MHSYLPTENAIFLANSMGLRLYSRMVGGCGRNDGENRITLRVGRKEVKFKNDLGGVV